MVSFLVILASVGATYGNPRESTRKDGRVDIRSLKTFNSTQPGSGYLAEEQIIIFSDFEIVPIPEEIGEIVIVLINYAVLDITWSDESDITYLFATWENQPDTVMAMLLDHDNTFDERDQRANPQDGEGTISLTWNGGDTYIGSALTRTDEHGWKGVDGPEYVDLKGGTVIWNDAIDATVMLVQSGDYVHQRIPYVFADDGNAVEATYTLAGYSLSIPPLGT